MEKKFSVTGMTCAACASGIERTVKKLDGVSACSVSLMGECLEVAYDPSVLTEEKIKETVFSLGYGAYDYGGAPAVKRGKEGGLFRRFLSSLFLLLPEMYLAMGHMVGLPVPHGWLNYGIQIGLTLAILLVNHAFFTSGVRAAVKGVPNMDTLVTLGASASFLYSVVVTVVSPGKAMFFDSAAMIVTLVTLGKWLEDRSKARTGREVEKLLSLAPDHVTAERDGVWVQIPLSEVRPGEILLARQGESIAADGVVLEGHAFVDQAAITGESLPVELEAGSRVMSASLVKSGYLRIRAEQVGEDTLLAGIIRMVKEAGASKAPIQKLADRVAAVFVPVVAGLALLTFAVWLIVSHDFSKAINFGVSVLVISCPCALGLATPVAVMAATGRGAAMGVLYKNAEALQRAAEIGTVLLDKTATLTEGTPRVVYFEAEDVPRAKALAYALECKLSHPLAQCITDFCGAGGFFAEHVEYLTGLGAKGEIGGCVYFLGNDRLLNDKKISFEQERERFSELSAEGKTVLFLADEKKVLALFALADPLKADSKEAVAAFEKMGAEVYMLTGDNVACARSIAAEAGIGADRVYAQVLPEDKLRAVSARKKENKALPKRSRRLVAMIGDGINDSPALKEADVGIAMGNGTDVAIESADIVLVNGTLSAAAKAFALSERTMRIIRQNLFWAFFYNCIGIPLAAGVFAWTGVTLDPMIAAAAMSLSSLFVVTNALRLTRFRKDKKLGQGDNDMNKTLTVEGMMCQNCVRHVREALAGVEGVCSVEVNLKKKRAEVRLSSEVSEETLAEAVRKAGYEVKKIV